jgi:hypothetical protein
MMTFTSSFSSSPFHLRNSVRMRRSLAVRLTTVIALLSLFQLPLHAKNSRQHSSAAEHAKTKKIKEFGNWPAGASPQEIGKRVAERYLSFTYLNLRRNPPGKYIIYPETCTWYGALTFAKLAAEKDLTERLIRRFDPLLGDQASLIPPPEHVDYTVFGSVPLEIHIQTNDQKYLNIGRSLADKQWEDPTPDGLTKTDTLLDR